MSVKVVIATHKPYSFPNSSYYIPVHVGKVLSKNDFGYLGDDTNQNISYKNPYYSELTALYWAWKNDFFSDVKYGGLVHYRRYFKGNLSFNDISILSSEETQTLLQKYDIILPKRRHYYIETIAQHYAHAHYAKDLLLAEVTLQNMYPHFIGAYKEVMQNKTIHLYNMFVMKKEYVYEYCTWLFPLLFSLEKQIDVTTYDAYQKRIFGFLAERLFNVWITYKTNQGLRIKTLPIVNIEGENLFIKTLGLLKRKYFDTIKEQI